jgi:hypothetical protein
MVPIAREAAEEWPQGEAENDQNIQNPNRIVEDSVEAEDDDPAPEVAIPAVVANAAVVANDDGGGFMHWGDVNLPDVHRKSSALYMPPPVIEESPPN